MYCKLKNCWMKNSKSRTGLCEIELRGVEPRRILYLREKTSFGIAKVIKLHLIKFIPIFLRKLEEWERKMDKNAEH